ncbi:S8 family serine peptidase [Streptomyces bobili]|uniref:S8 family serine peptidase n=1 Tax=Streptomyces bobili TaxID=67280 RepID=UPI003420A337
MSRALPWAQHRLGAGGLARFGEGDGITVGVVDTGVSASSEALRGRVAGAPAALRDCVGHGTFMAGIIAAAPRSGVQFSGLAPAARILAARGTDASGVAGAELVARGIRATVDGGADVVVVSAALARTTRELTSAVRYAQQHDVLIVAPAVPDGQPGFTDVAAAPEPFWPAAQHGVLAVVDVDIDGSRPDGGLVPLRADLAAPGQDVTGIGPLGEGHYLANGASVAAAFVTGAAALVRAHEPGLTAAQTAERLKRGSYPADVPRLDVVGALTGVPPSERPGPTFQDSSVRLRPAAGHNPAQGRAVALAGLCLVGALVLGAVRWLTVRPRRAGGA